MRLVDSSPSASAEDRQIAQLLNLGYGFVEDDAIHWQERALCAQTDPDIFFPEKGGSIIPATAICRECPVESDCLEYAISHDIRHGIWGGMSDNDRRRLARSRRSGS
ncbi:MAG: WhiB family transcriptional regulator [Actinomycetaceae bacterium]|nr:WhiB family transcriptional regulator [Actinomycetaceae bacterium]MDY6082803.1 WhiB family transcriptional regulator [Actinomycetaceae bacterium]